MKNICVYFQIHHPFTFQTFRFFDIGESKSYYDDARIEMEIHEAATNYYLPTNDFLLKLIHQSKGKLKLSFYISGTSLDQFLRYEPSIINSFRKLNETGSVEFIGGTSSHSISSMAETSVEFRLQIKRNQERMEYYFGHKPKIFANTDLLYSNQIARIVSETGYQAMITNGTKKILQWRSPNYLYSGENKERIRIIFRNEGISNLFSNLLTQSNSTEKQEQLKQLFVALNTIHSDEPMVNIYLNYKTLGGFEIDTKQLFFRNFVSRILNLDSFCFCLPTELIEQFGTVGEIEIENPNCWVENFHSSYYPGNNLQQEALKQLFKLEKLTDILKNTNLKIDWQYLQTSDHFHLMDENHSDYANGSNSGIYKSKYDAFINYMNILEDFRQRIIADRLENNDRKPLHQSIPPTKISYEHVL